MAESFSFHAFSSDSESIHPSNTLSSFTVELDYPIEIKTNETFEVALNKIVYNPIETSSVNHENSGIDIISVSHNEIIGENFKKVEDFATFLVRNSFQPRLYNESYFKNYLDKSILFTSKILDREPFLSDTLDVSEKDKKVTINLQITEFLDSAENVKDFLPKHLRDNQVFLESMKEITVRFYLREQSMKSALNTIIWSVILFYKNLFKALVQNDELSGVFSEIFFNASAKFESPTDVVHFKRLHVTKSYEMIRRVILKFVKSVEKAGEEVRKEVILLENKFPEFSAISAEFHPKPRFMMIYLDIMENQLVGGKKVRLLASIPLEVETKSENVSNFFTHTVSNPNFLRVEQQHIKSINFLLLTEFGEQIPFIASSSATYIELCFRKK